MSSPPFTPSTSITLKADTGATNHFISTNDLGYLQVKPPTELHPPINALVPTGHTMTSKGHVHLPISHIPPSASLAHVMPKLASGSLMSVGKICDAGCTAIFDSTSVKIYKNKHVNITTKNKPIIYGTRNSLTKPLYSIQLPTIHHINTTIHNPTIRNRVAFYHKALFSPTVATWLNAHKNKFLESWPAITATQITKYAPFSIATIQGHRHAHRSNIRSTKRKTGPLPLTYTASTNNTEEIVRTNNIFIDNIEITGRTFSDQTGRFVCPSISGNNYVFVLYDFDSNSIHALPIPTRKKEHIVSAFQKIVKRLTLKGFKPQLHKLDNETSQLMSTYMDNEQIKYELTPTGLHRRNLAERAIQTFKNHFIAGLCSTHPDFPLNLWDKLLPQAELTLNLLRPSRIQPHLSAYAQLYGPFQYNSTPIAPPGIKVLLHERPEQRNNSWSPHNVQGWYLGPAMHHYRQHRIWVPATNAERIGDTVTWLPHHVHMPTSTAEDIIVAAANDLTHALLQSDSSPLLPPINTETRKALQQLQQIFNDKFAHPLKPLPSEHTDELPRVPTITTPKKFNNIIKNTADFKQLSTILQQRRRQRTATKTKTTPSTTSTTKQPRRSLRIRKTTPRYTDHLNAVLDPTTGKLLEYRDLLKNPKVCNVWYDACSKEFARLCNGRKKDNTKGTNSIRFKKPSQLPPGKKATYLRICANYRPQKSDPYRIRFTVGGNLVNYNGETYTPTSDLITAKILFNSVISTLGAKFFTIDLSNFYLITPIENEHQYEYMFIPTWVFPKDIKTEYNIDALSENGKVLAEITTGMYGLPQAGILAYRKLVQHLKDAGFIPAKFTPGLFKHTTRPISFCLVVDDFGIKYSNKKDADYLISELKKHYDVTIDWEGKIFCGIHLKWDYKNRKVTCSMPGIAQKGLQRFKHPNPSRPQHSPHPWTAPTYGKNIQYAQTNTNNDITKEQKKSLQQIIGYYLYYGRAIDNTILPSLGSISTSLNTSTWKELSSRVKWLLDYIATHPEPKIEYQASNMHLWVHTDASYLNESKARSRGAGYFFLSNKPNLPIRPDDPPPPTNGPIDVNCKVIDAVMSSAQESETGMGFINAKSAIEKRLTLEFLGHKQGPTPIQFDNKAAVGILTDQMTQRRSKAMDMRFYWLKDRAAQGQFHIHWKRGMTNLADYHTKHHPTSHHRNVRSTYVLNTVSSFPSKRHCKGVLKPSNRYKPLHTKNRCTLKTVGRFTLTSPATNQA